MRLCLDRFGFQHQSNQSEAATLTIVVSETFCDSESALHVEVRRANNYSNDQA